jgi:galactan 5-O-arabinofuranosyltransferase
VVAQLERAPTAPRTAPRTRAVTAASLAPWVVLAAAVLVAGGAAWVLRSSPFPPGGLTGDQGFRTAAIARDAAHLFPVDFAYRGLVVFYPPAFFVVLGRLVAVTGMPAYEALKLGIIAVAFLVPVVGYRLWRRLTGDAVTAAAVAVASVAFAGWFEPYAWIAAAAFVPWWLTFVVRIGVVHPGVPCRDGGRRRVVVGSLIGALILSTYYYFFFIGAVQLVALLGATWIGRRRNRGLPLRVTRESWMVLAGTAVVSAPYWAPLVFTMATAGAVESLQNRYFNAGMIAFPVPFLDRSVPGAVMLFGLVALLTGCRRSALMLGLTTLLGAAYAWFVLGYAAVLADSPVLAARTVVLIDVVLLAGAGVGAVHVARAVTASGRWARDRPRWALPASVLAVGLVVLTASSLGAIPSLGEQRAAREPRALLRDFDRALGDHARGLVVLTDASSLISFRPVYLFNVWNAHYSNPAAEFSARSRFLTRLASEDDPAVVATALRHNRYDRVGAIVLDAAGSSLVYTDYQDNFPRGTRARTLHFTRAQFDRRWFEPTVTRARAVFVARSVDPARSLDGSQLAELRRHFAGDLASPEPAYRPAGSESITNR